MLALSLPSHPQVSAHGGGTPKLINADIGPYWISAWVRPDPPQIDNFHLTIALSEPTDPTAALREAGPPILNATIQVQFQSVTDPNNVVTAIASHENATNKFLYEADLILPHPGFLARTNYRQRYRWRTRDKSHSTQSPLLPPAINITWIVLAGILVFLLALWLLRRSLTSVPTN